MNAFVGDEDEESANESFVPAALLLADSLYNIQRDIHYKSEPIERKYLRFNSPMLFIVFQRDVSRCNRGRVDICKYRGKYYRNL
jgi:hypothetical protein